MAITVRQWSCRQCYGDFWVTLSETVTRCPYCGASGDWLTADLTATVGDL
ncbi:hypothetical protein Sulac_1129 [Sulfobacillus acidophilus DSM 10332]|uniref:Hydrogenase maturation nickel metallochaperone HypA n=1 Tax=Sulfobacillus acidophilus (strain ATCC 700253 / DSM 10332 / NAL) TaxID=679936 RepID=G8TUI2_SULAD|nr:hypothetical protein Sulac_1129 [Sulfobacillus acidophilus DSM 10332]